MANWFPIASAPRDKSLLTLGFSGGQTVLARSRLHLDALPDGHPARQLDPTHIWLLGEGTDPLPREYGAPTAWSPKVKDGIGEEGDHWRSAGPEMPRSCIVEVVYADGRQALTTTRGAAGDRLQDASIIAWRERRHRYYWVYLDDERHPPALDDQRADRLEIVRDFGAWVEIVDRLGCPSFVSFDHDLGIGQSGFDCAKWFVEWILEDPTRLKPRFRYGVHSRNPVGKQNIAGLLEPALAHVHEARTLLTRSAAEVCGPGDGSG